MDTIFLALSGAIRWLTMPQPAAPLHVLFVVAGSAWLACQLSRFFWKKEQLQREQEQAALVASAHRHAAMRAVKDTYSAITR